MLNLQGVSAGDAVVCVLKCHAGESDVSEIVRDDIYKYGGNYYSVETIGRRLRERVVDGLIGSKDVKANGKKYKKFYYKGGV